VASKFSTCLAVNQLELHFSPQGPHAFCSKTKRTCFCQNAQRTVGEICHSRMNAPTIVCVFVFFSPPGGISDCVPPPPLQPSSSGGGVCVGRNTSEANPLHAFIYLRTHLLLGLDRHVQTALSRIDEHGGRGRCAVVGTRRGACQGRAGWAVRETLRRNGGRVWVPHPSPLAGGVPGGVPWWTRQPRPHPVCPPPPPEEVFDRTCTDYRHLTAALTRTTARLHHLRTEAARPGPRQDIKGGDYWVEDDDARRGSTCPSFCFIVHHVKDLFFPKVLFGARGPPADLLKFFRITEGKG